MKHRYQILLVSLASGTLASAGTVPPSYDFQWSTIGDPGNRATLDSEIYDPFNIYPNPRVGAVNYEYRMATTEVTVGQYFEFAQQYHPIYTKNTGNVLGFSDFTGGDIRLAFGEIMIREGVSANKPIEMGWEYATRYVNWLHNGKVNEEWAFETGVYDTSTFTRNPDGSINHQTEHDPDAGYWLPTRDEWTKAAYWDPTLNGGDGGYWQFTTSSDIEPIPGEQRNAGFSSDYPMDVGSFSEYMSPWGILDLEGGVYEWTETEANGQRIVMGSGGRDGSYEDPFYLGRLGRSSTGTPFNGFGGIRLVSVVPAPGTLLVLMFVPVFVKRRTR